MTTSRRALVLLAHGSPDPEWMAPIDGAAARIKALAADVDVAIATLEALRKRRGNQRVRDENP